MARRLTTLLNALMLATLVASGAGMLMLPATASASGRLGGGGVRIPV